jgi:hypothetical protein
VHWRSLAVLLLLVILVLAVAFVLLASTERRLLFYPRPYTKSDLDSARQAGVELVRYHNTEGEQVAFFVRKQGGLGDPARLWVLFDGNGSLALDWLGFVSSYPN